MRSVICAALTVLPLAAGHNAVAGELRTMTFDPATTNSECIGNPVTPLCAAETAQACFMWERPDLCRAIGYEPDHPLGVDDYGRLSEYKYEPVGEFFLKNTDIPDWAREQRKRSWQPGDLAYDLW